MNRHSVACASVTVFALLGLVLRLVIHRRRTGAWAVNGLSGRVGSPAWWGGVSFSGSIIAIPSALALDSIPTPAFFAVPALALMGGGLALTLVAQSGMGASWRIGVLDSERTELITTGLFAWVRNPIFTGMCAFGAGLVLLWPNAVTMIAFALLVVGVQLQVRFVEEPWLQLIHGEAWRSWARNVGRFVPALGKSQ